MEKVPNPFSKLRKDELRKCCTPTPQLDRLRFFYAQNLAMTIKQQLTEILKNRILILDGAMGTMIQRHKLEEEDFRDHPKLKNHPSPLKGNNDLLSVTRPEIIKDIHRQYFEAGADIAETNTFSGTTVAQADYGLEFFVDEINFQSAKIARQIADDFTKKQPNKPRFVAGSIGPTNKTASMSPDVNNPAYRAITFNELVVAYSQQVEGLIKGGVHILLVETVFDTLNAKAALFAIHQTQEKLGTELPIMVSGTITDASGRTLSGQTPEAFLISISHMPLLSVGFNCALGPIQLKPHLQAIQGKSNFFISAHPNAGLPNEFGEYDLDPKNMAQQVKPYIDEGLVNILGGCCGTTPEHIREMALLGVRR